MTKCNSASPKTRNTVVQQIAIARDHHSSIFGLSHHVSLNQVQPHGLNLAAWLLENICTYLPDFQAQRCQIGLILESYVMTLISCVLIKFVCQCSRITPAKIQDHLMFRIRVFTGVSLGFLPFLFRKELVLHLTKTYLISIFSTLCYFLCFLIKQKATPSGSERYIIALSVQTSVCLEMNILDKCCVLKDPWVVGLI